MLASGQFKRLKSKNPLVAKLFQKYWQVPLGEYSQNLYYKKSVSFEAELEEAFIEEWQKYGIAEIDASKLLSELKRQPVLQTSHHVTPTNGPTFFANDLISLAGLAKDATYLVAASSGVAFSNAAWSGALSFGEIPIEELLDSDQPAYQKALQAARDRKTDGTSDNRISLIPSRQRDQLVFGAKISTQLLDVYNQFSFKLHQLLLKPAEGQTYSIWSCLVSTQMQKKIFRRKEILTFDINRVVCSYLIKILAKSANHPVIELLFDKKTNETFNQIFQNPNLFLGSYKSKKSMKIEPLAWKDSCSIGAKSGSHLFNRDSLAEALQKESICPGIILQFLVLKFINGIKCLGSFNQLEYLEEYRNNWREMNLNWDLKLDEDEGHALTTGRMLRNGRGIYPFDLMWKDEWIDIYDFYQRPMSEFWMPIVHQLAN